MSFAADLHVHSRYSRATSKNLTLVSLHHWARRKGLSVVGTGDFTHPAWRAELNEQLVAAEPGLFRLKEEFRAQAESGLPRTTQGEVRFVLQVEISTIYKRDGQTRKVHHVILSPTLEGAERLSTELGKLGNVSSDGRPILGLDSRTLLELVLEHCPGGCLIPAHIWTPWFSVLGSKSGFDDIRDCYGDLTEHIFAVETGLSSDPPMNWRVSSLDRFTLVSNSDAHSPNKLARECNLFDTDLSFQAMMEALKTRDGKTFRGTIEFFPEEGKYHVDGHRKCGLRLSPAETRAAKGRCPGCGRPITVGVSHRVEELADRPEGARPEVAPPFISLIGLAETLGHVLECGPTARRVEEVYEHLQDELGPELEVLLSSDLREIERLAGDLVAEAIRRVRAGEVRWFPGFDGEYGQFEILSQEERRARSNQISFFGAEEQVKPASKRVSPPPHTPPPPQRARETARQQRTEEPPRRAVGANQEDALLAGLDEAQLEAVVASPAQPILVIAGPGTGKTRTLTTRIAHRLRGGELLPEQTLALTFTNRAAEEMAERLASMLGEDVAARLTVSTFHSWGLATLRAAGLARPKVIDESKRRQLLAEACTVGASELPASAQRKVGELISLQKSGKSLSPEELPVDHEIFQIVFERYEELLAREGCFDFDDLVLRAAEAMEDEAAALPPPPRAIFVDEYQDLNGMQVRLLKAVFRRQGQGELFAIGDPDQAIYGFRGADPRMILDFEKDWPGALLLALQRSYRSSEVILQAAGQVIERTPGLERRKLWSGIEGSPHLLTLSAGDELAEAERIALLVEKLLGGTGFLSFDSGLVEDGGDTLELSFSDVAVLYRLKSQGDLIARALGKLGLPVKMASDQAALEGPAVEAVLETLGELAGRASSLTGAAPDRFGPLSEIGAAEIVRRVGVEFYGENEAALAQLGPLLGAARRSDEEWARKARKSASFVKLGRPLDELLDWLALHAGLDQCDRRSERISLLTLHAAKGLEWKVVIIAGCEEGLLPYRRPGTEPDLDEERRLFFVGMTRAEHLLVLSRAERRWLYGKELAGGPSPFLLEIEERLRQSEVGQPKKREKPRDDQMSLF